MFETDMIQWTPVDRRPAANGDTQYRGTFDGVAMFVIHGTGRTPGEGRPADRRFSAFRLTSAGTEHPVGAGGQHKTLRAAKAACDDELDAMGEAERSGLVELLKERRTLLGVLDAVGAAREAHRMTLPELRDAVAALKVKVEITPAPAEPEPATPTGPTEPDEPVSMWPRVDEYDDGSTVWRVGDRVKFPGPVYEIGDVWRVDSIAVPLNRPPYAGLTLAHRAGGLPLGTTHCALGLRHLSRVVEQAPAPTPSLREVLRQLRDERLPGWVLGCMDNDAAMQRPDRERDPERYVLLPADVRTLIDDIARDYGITL